MKELPTLNVIIAGHIDHGKTTLLQRLSGKWTDTHSEEMKRGITIKLGYADITIFENNGEYNRESKGKALRYVSFIDAPGHEMLMATMLSGTAIVDAALLVVAANEGIKPQTREHLIALQAKRVKNVIVLQNKVDLVSKEQAKKNYNEILELFKAVRGEKPIVIPVSAQQNVNISKIYQALCELPIPERDLEGDPMFIVARSFDINKPGTTPEKLSGAVLGGTLKKGILRVGDEIEIKPGIAVKEANQIHYKTLRTRINKLFKGSGEVNEITPGGSVSIETSLDMALGKSDLLSGAVVSHSGKLPEIAFALKMKYKLFSEVLGAQAKTNVDALKPSETIMMSINTSVTIGMIKKLGKDEAEVHLRIPIVPFKGENIAIARNIANHWRLIGYGEIL
ncbi:MAG: translation initiation factor IF-2 subunit gamma [Nanoarchaeota archaeon]